MAASAYAALASLSHVLQQIQHPARHQLHFDKSQIETLHEIVRFLLDFFEGYSKFVCHADLENLMRVIANIINDAEDVIDSHVVDQLSQRSADKADMGYSYFCEDIERIIQKIRPFFQEFAEFREKQSSSQEQKPSVSLPAAAGSSAPPAPYGKNTMVGFDDHLARIKDRLTGGESRLQIVPIVGMGGIGKTTLAQNVFHDPCFKNHFDIRMWFTISQEYSVLDILLGLLHGSNEELGDKKKKESNSKDIAELGQALHKMLFGRRYLIVLDDVWTTNVWDDLKFYFPDNREGSRIIVTTRLSRISDFLGNESSYSVDLLDSKKSWELFCKKVFGKVGCPDPELEEIGMSIASDCKGLPLAIVLIGGLLSKSKMTIEYWVEVAKNVNLIVNSEDDELCLNILSLSYNHLPVHLRPCFLYMRVFPEDYNIRVSQLIKSWIAEGFVISEGGKTLEEVAREYLKDLIDRNLVLTNQLEDGGKKMCGIHDLLRDFCLREYQKEHIFRIAKVYVNTLMKGENICHMCGVRDASKSMSFSVLHKTSSFAICSVCDICGMICPRLNTLRLVDVIHLRKAYAYPLPTKLRYLDVRSEYYTFKSTWLHLFWNLQTLVFYSKGVIDLPTEIWEMPQLRHVKFSEAILPEPPVTPTDRKDAIILANLQTLGFLVDFSCSEKILERIPNLKKLKIAYVRRLTNWSRFRFHNLTHLHKLESLTVNLYLPWKMKVFPRSLKKLTLERCEFPWEEMTIIGSLPNLEVLKLKRKSFTGEEWNPVEGEFLQLKSLSIQEIDLVHWNAEKDHFPKLEFLVLYDMERLEKIPSGIGDIETLLSIRLLYCPDSVVNSAKEIVAEQQTYGNDSLQLHLHRC